MADGVTLGTATRYNALVRSTVVVEEDGETVRRNIRELLVWLEQDADPQPGQRCEIVTAGDVSLVGKAGTVTSVIRDSLAAVRRCTVELSNDA